MDFVEKIRLTGPAWRGLDVAWIWGVQGQTHFRKVTGVDPFPRLTLEHLRSREVYSYCSPWPILAEIHIHRFVDTPRH